MEINNSNTYFYFRRNSGTLAMHMTRHIMVEGGCLLYIQNLHIINST